MEAVVENANEATPEIKSETKPETQPETKVEPEPTDAFKKLLSEKRNWQQKAQEEEKRRKELEETYLKEKEDYKTLYGNAQSKLDELQTKLETEQREKVNGFKLSSLKSELTKMGADTASMDALLRLADINALKYDGDHKVVLGTEEVARQIKEQIPRAFGNGNTAGVDQSAPASIPTDLDFAKLTPEQRRDPAILKQIYEKRGVKVRD